MHAPLHTHHARTKRRAYLKRLLHLLLVRDLEGLVVQNRRMVLLVSELSFLAQLLLLRVELRYGERRTQTQIHTATIRDEREVRSNTHATMATTRRLHAYLGQALGRERRVLLGLFELRQSALGRLTLLMEGSLGLDERLALLVQVGLQLRDQGRELRKAHVRRRERERRVSGGSQESSRRCIPGSSAWSGRS